MRCAESKDVNVASTMERIGEAADRGADIVCLQELFAGRYPCQSEDHRRFADAEPVPGPTTEMLAEKAAQCGIVVVGSIFERRAAGLYHNTAVVLDADGTLSGVYRKMHIPDDPLYYEKFYFAPGDCPDHEDSGAGYQGHDTRYGNVGVCVCWDQWFPEAARLTALTGAQILFYPTAIGWLPNEKQEFGASQHSAWETMMRSHAIANGVYVAAVNRTGQEENLEFWGASFVADPNGNVLARSPHDREDILVVECDLNKIDIVRTHWPFLRDRRVDSYGGLTKRWLGR